MHSSSPTRTPKLQLTAKRPSTGDCWVYFCFIDYAKVSDCADHNKLWTVLQVMGIPGHLTCHLRNLYAGQEATVRTGHGTTDWFQTGKGVHQGCIFSPCLFILHAEYIMRNESVMPSNHLILYHPLPLLPSIFPSTSIFSSESALHIRWPKYWSFSYSISPSNEHSVLISFRIDWFDLLAVQGTLKGHL